MISQLPWEFHNESWREHPTITTVDSDFIAVTEDEEDAEYIVKACNSFKAMKAELKQARNVIMQAIKNHGEFEYLTNEETRLNNLIYLISYKEENK